MTDLNIEILEYLPLGIAIVSNKELIYVNSKAAQALEIHDELPISATHFFRFEELHLFESVYNLADQSLYFNNKVIKYSTIKLENGNILIQINPCSQRNEIENKYKLLVEFSPEAIVIIDTDNGKFNDVNQSAEYLFKMTKEELLSCGPADVSPSIQLDGRPSVISTDIYKRVLNGENLILEWLFKDKKGKEVYCEIRLTKLPADKLNLVRGTIIDITSRKKSEFELMKSEQRFREFAELLPEIVFETDMTGKFTFLNNLGLEILGLSKINQAANSYIFDVLNDEDKEKAHYILKKCINGENLKGIEFSLHTRKSEVIPCLCYLSVIYSDKQPVGIRGVVTDVTEFKKTEIKLRKSQNRLRQIIDLVPHMIFAKDKEGRFMLINKAVADAYNLDIKDIIGKKHTDIHQNADEIKRIRLHDQDVLKNKMPQFNSDEKFTDAFGNEHILQTLKIPFMDIDSTEPAVLGISIDITDQKLQKESSERSREMLKQAQKLAALGSWDWDLINNIIYWSDEMYSLLNLPFNSMLKAEKWLDEYILSDDQSRINNEFQQALKTEKTFNMEFRVLTSDNLIKNIYSVCQIYRSENNTPTRIIGTWLDITEQKQQERYLEQAKLQAEQADKLKSVFLANMSHDIRSPMNAILGFVGLLQDDTLTAENRNDYLEHIRYSGNHLLSLIDDIIDIVKIEAGQVTIKKENADITKVLQELNATYENIITQSDRKNLKIVLNTPGLNTPVYVNTDLFRFNQIINNLIGNALKFTEEGTIEFGFDQKKFGDQHFLMFYVRDTGIGIPSDKLELIFDRFGRIDEHQNINREGTGLGLSICKSLVELLGGKIWAQSVVGKGSTFYFTLPFSSALQVSLPEKVQTKSVSSKNFNWEGKVILIAEDETMNYRLLEVMLRRTKAKILWAKNGKEALEMCISNKLINLVLMDIQMPVMNGYDATMEIKKVNPKMPVIAQTAFAMAGEKDKCIEAGCNGYLPKPINPDKLFVMVDSFLFS